MTHDMIEKSSGNVFADLGVNAPNEMLAKAKLASVILDIIKDLGLTQLQAAKVLDTDQSYTHLIMVFG